MCRRYPVLNDLKVATWSAALCAAFLGRGSRRAPELCCKHAWTAPLRSLGCLTARSGAAAQRQQSCIFCRDVLATTQSGVARLRSAFQSLQNGRGGRPGQRRARDPCLGSVRRRRQQHRGPLQLRAEHHCTSGPRRAALLLLPPVRLRDPSSFLWRALIEPTHAAGAAILARRLRRTERRRRTLPVQKNPSKSARGGAA